MCGFLAGGDSGWRCERPPQGSPCSLRRTQSPTAGAALVPAQHLKQWRDDDGGGRGRDVLHVRIRQRGRPRRRGGALNVEPHHLLRNAGAGSSPSAPHRAPVSRPAARPCLADCTHSAWRRAQPHLHRRRGLRLLPLGVHVCRFDQGLLPPRWAKGLRAVWVRALWSSLCNPRSDLSS